MSYALHISLPTRQDPDAVDAGEPSTGPLVLYADTPFPCLHAGDRLNLAQWVRIGAAMPTVDLLVTCVTHHLGRMRAGVRACG